MADEENIGYTERQLDEQLAHGERVAESVREIQSLVKAAEAAEPVEVQLWRDALATLDIMVLDAVNEDINAGILPPRERANGLRILEASGILYALAATVFRQDQATTQKIASAMLAA